LRDPDDGRPLVDHVWRREDLFAGAAVNELPDLHVCLRDYAYHVVVDLNEKADSLFGFPWERKQLLYHNGTHKSQGI
ncbi:MAG: hypothetical protein GWN58_40370, partial [Anaerolineae bacterium]|nr:hypothetical protein [Anaerolineae bacterium]